ncbi:hypothetical protein OG985_03755 [Streptomyces sp. NBC_00289]|uniref:hypothetical protein n=1 Tax=Streptomyces sp. NBC_00289 TaxID=2975703 RepID=UPI003244CE1A
MSGGREAGTERRRLRVQDAITTAVRHGTPLTASAIARAAGVDRTFLYRHRDLLESLRTTGSRCAETLGAGLDITQASLQADLANANARAGRLAGRVQQLEARLSQQLGQRAWQESGLGASADVCDLQATVARLEQHVVQVTRRLEELQGDLDAARSANRELTRALNQREVASPSRSHPEGPRPGRG